MPFGRHRGQRLEDVPLDYLEWVLREADNASPYLRQAVEAEVRRRYGVGQDAPPPRLEWQPLVRKWYGRLSLKHHPDRGGSHQAMLAINDARDLLVQLLESDP
jgi:hypothetical protein